MKISMKRKPWIWPCLHLVFRSNLLFNNSNKKLRKKSKEKKKSRKSKRNTKKN